MISGIIKVSVSVISLSLRLRLIKLTSTLIIPDITKTESNNCFIIYCFEENNDKSIIAAITVYFQTLKNVQLSDKQIFTVFTKQSSAEKLNAFLKKVSLKKTVDEANRATSFPGSLFSASIVVEKRLFSTTMEAEKRDPGNEVGESRSHSYFAVCELDIAVRALDITLGNHVLRPQPTDYSLIYRYRLVNNL